MPGTGPCAFQTSATLLPMATVELHVISDATGATAKRLVQALEAQFPDQEFEDIVHPRVETVDDLRLAVDRAKGRPAVILYTLVDQELREAMRALCKSARVHYCDILGHPIDAVARVSGQPATMTPGRPAAARLELLQAHGGDRVRGQVRRRRDGRAGGRGHRPRRRLAHLEDAALDLSRLPRLPRRERPGREGDRAASALFRVDPKKVVGLTIDAERLAEIRTDRARRLGGNNRRYRDLTEIYDELEAAEKLHKRLGCPVIEISELSIEETAARVIQVVEQRLRAAAPAS